MKNKLIFLSVALVMLLALSFTACSGNGETEPPAPKTYTIQYTDNVGNHTITVKTGEVYSLEAIPQKTGYDFLGLFDMEEGGTQYVTSTGNSLSAFNDGRNMTLFPQFKAKEYTLVLDYQGAEVTGTRQISVSYDSMIGSLPTNLTIANKNFTGWYTQPDKQGVQVADKYGVLPATSKVTEKNFDLSDPDGIINLYAGFKYQEYTLTLYIGESSVPEEILVEWGTHISSVQTETRVDGKAVLTWSKSKNDTALANVFNGKVDGDMILYSAEYAPVIDFNSMGGENVNSIVNRAGNTISLPTPKRENYTFIGWFDTTGTQFTSTVMPEASITLNAKWQANIMLNENGGTDVQDITAPAGTAIELPTPERAGYIFAGWYTVDKTKYEDTRMPSESVVLKAGWYKEKTDKITIVDGNSILTFDAFRSVVELRNDLTIDLSHILPANFEGYVYLDAHLMYEHNWASLSSPRTINLYFYKESIVSESNLLFSTTATATTTEYCANSYQQKVYLNGNKIYCGAIHKYRETTNPHITDYYIYVTYGDTSVIY